MTAVIMTSLVEAARAGDATQLRQLLQAGARDCDVGDALHAAAASGQLKTTALLLAEGADTGVLSEADGRAPLHVAAAAGHVNVVKQLVHANADPQQRDRNGHVPMDTAVFEGHSNVVAVLLEAGKPRRQAPTAIANGLIPEGGVLLHVYNLGLHPGTRKLNSAARLLGGGLYHTAVEVVGLTDGHEWSYGHASEGTGVFDWAARENPHHAFRETIPLGRTRLKNDQLTALLERLKGEWRGGDYHLVSHNCQTFSSTLCAELAVSPPPEWVLRFAKIGHQLLRRGTHGGVCDAQGRSCGDGLGVEPSAARSQTAREGIALLKRGVRAIKYGRHGKPHATVFRLSEDESVLSWEGRVSGRHPGICCSPAYAAGRTGLVVGRARSWMGWVGVVPPPLLALTGAPHSHLLWQVMFHRSSIELVDVVELQVGHASEVLRRSAAEAATSRFSSPRGSKAEELPAEHLTLTLMMMAALPAPPSAEEQHDPHGRRLALDPQLEALGSPPTAQRQTLDLACTSEEEFGLWVAALRALLGEVQNEAALMVAATAVPTQSLAPRRDERSAPRVSEGSDKWL